MYAFSEKTPALLTVQPKPNRDEATVRTASSYCEAASRKVWPHTCAGPHTDAGNSHKSILVPGSELIKITHRFFLSSSSKMSAFFNAKLNQSVCKDGGLEIAHPSGADQFEA